MAEQESGNRLPIGLATIAKSVRRDCEQGQRASATPECWLSDSGRWGQPREMLARAGSGSLRRGRSRLAGVEQSAEAFAVL